MNHLPRDIQFDDERMGEALSGALSSACLLTAKQVAALLQVHVTDIRGRKIEGLPEAIHLGERRARWRLRDVQRFIEQLERKQVEYTFNRRKA